MREDVKPGVRMHSPEWFDATATRVAEPLREAVENICMGWVIPDHYAPNMISGMVENSLRGVMSRTHIIAGGQEVRPIEVRFNGERWSFIGEIVNAVGEVEEPNLVVYDTRDIEKTAKPQPGEADGYAHPV